MIVRLTVAAALVGGLAAQGTDPVGHVRRGVAAREAGRLDEARRELEAAVAAAPGIAEAHLYLGLVLHESGDPAAAADALRTALSLKPTLPGAHQLLGYSLLTLGRPEEAVPHLEAARRESPDEWRVHSWLGRARLGAGEPGAALPHLLEAQAHSPQDPEVLYLLGKAHSQLAARAQAQLLATAADSAYAHLAVAEDHDHNGRVEQALAAYGRALAEDETLTGAWLAVGDLEGGRGNHRAAADAYQQALTTQPADGAVLLKLAQSLLALGLAHEALPHLEAAVAAERAPPAAREALAKACLDLGHFARAREELALALEAAGDEQRKMKIHYQLARASGKVGDLQAERRHLQAFADLRAKLTAGDK